MPKRAGEARAEIGLRRRNVYWRLGICFLAALTAVLGARAAGLIAGVAAAAQIQNSVAVVTVSAASFIGAPAPLAPSSIVSAFGTQLATQTASAVDADPGTPGIQLPTSLGGTTVDVNGVRAGLLFVSAGQVNFVLPAQTAIGTAQIVITSTLANNDQMISRGTALIAATAPALFAANSNGQGAPAALTGRIDASGTMFVYDPGLPLEPDPLRPGFLLPAPINVGTAERPAFLILFGTGIRNAPPGSVRAVIGGVDAPVTFAGVQPDFVALDQVNVQIPVSLRGRGRVDLTVIIGGVSSNTLTINLAGTAGAGLSVSGFSVGSGALAGQTVTITGSGFSANPDDNIVRFGAAQGRVVSASATQMSVIVPFGAESGRVTVQNASGEVRSADTFRVLTSISGIVQSTGAPGSSPAPLEGVTLRLAGESVSVRTNRQGGFVLSGIRPGAALIEIEGGTVSASPPYPRLNLKMTVSADRDNQFTQPISLQQITGASTTVGSGGKSEAGVAQLKAALSQRAALPRAARSSLASRQQALNLAPPANVVITDRGVALDVPVGTSVRFPDGKTRGTVQLTVLEKSRLPGINLPVGIYSSTIVQITPLGTTFTPGAILSFPNPDPANLQAGAKVDLFRYDFQAGGFIRRGTATVSADKTQVVSDGRIVDQASYWFAAVPAGVTTVIGRVIDGVFGFSVAGAQVTVNGRAAISDQNGGFSIADVATAGAPTVQAEAVLPQQYGTLPRGTSAITPVVAGGVTNVGLIALSNTRQAAIVLSPFILNLDTSTAKARLDATLTQPAPAGGLTVSLSSDDTTVVTVPASVTIAAGQTTASFDVTRAGPGVAFIDASATLSGSPLESFAVVTVAQPAPVLTSVNPASAPPGAKIVISGTGFSVKPDNNYVAFLSDGDLVALLDPEENEIINDGTGKPALRVTVPEISGGAVELVVLVADDLTGIFSDLTEPLIFTVLASNLPAPQLTSLAPPQGKPLDEVTINGSGFGGTVFENEVIFRQNGLETEAFIIDATATQLLVKVPSFDIRKGPATVFARRLATSGARSAASNALDFTVTEDPAVPPTPTLISVLNSETQTASGRDGDVITVRGTGFGTNFLDLQGELGNDDPLLSVLLFYQNNEFITFEIPIAASGDGRQLSAIVPTGLSAGPVQITVFTLDLESDLFSDESAPANFIITVGSLRIVDEDEPNDTPELATDVFLPSIVEGDIDITDLGDFEITFTDGSKEKVKDLFFLTLDQTTDLALDLQFTQSGDLDLFVFEARPGSSGNHRILASSTSASGTSETIFIRLAPGDYLIGVGIFSGGSFYDLTIDKSAAAQAELSGKPPVKARFPVAARRGKP
jgi:uncharacterized protein (TIGR03437 family)